jgi:threonine/homoserine/homoserine lactone efflux protein
LPDLSTLILFISACIALLVVPGPTLALVIARSLAGGQRVALPLVIGVGLGDLVAASVALAGAGALLASSATAFTIVKVIGALYLIWLGIRLFRSEPVPLDMTAKKDSDDGWRALRDGFLVTLFNPKGILFFVAFVPQFIVADRDYMTQSAVFVITFALLGMVNGAIFALGSNSLRHLLARANVLRGINRVSGVLIFSAGIAALFARRPAV